VGDTDDDDGDGNVPSCSTFTRGERLFQQRPMGNKAAKAMSREEGRLVREAAAQAVALESLASSAAKRTALEFWSPPAASSSPKGRK